MPFIAKVLIALPMLDIIWAAYRICKSVKKENWTGVIIGALFALFAAFPVAIFDIVYLIWKQDTVWWMD